MATTASTTSPGLGTTSGTGLGAPAGGAGTYGRVIVTLKSAHDLRDKTWIGKADPYCMVKVADAEIQTHHVKNAGDHAVWEESFAFNNVAPDDVIELSVYDHNRLMKDSLMGTGSLTLRQVFVEGRLETRVPLTSRTGTKEAGEVWVSLRCEGGPSAAGGMGAGAAGAGVETAGYEKAGYTETAATTVSTKEALAGTHAVGAGVHGPEVVGAPTTPTYTAAPAPGATQVTTAGVATGEAVQTGREAVCSQEYFTKMEDRPVVKERVTYLREHRPVEKAYVVETRATGVERDTGVREQEHMGAQNRVVSVAPPAPEERGEEYFTKVEDRPVVKERTTLMKTHVPVEREYVTETRATGVERDTGVREQEHMGAQDRVVSVAPPAPEERGEEYYTKVDDRPVVKERTTLMKTHRPVEKEYVVETRATGVERDTGIREEEPLGAEHRVVSEAQPGNPCD